MNRRHVTGFFGVLWQAVRDGNLLGQPRSPFPSPPTQVRLSKTHRCRENFNDTATAKTRRCRENLNDAATAKHKRESTLCISGNALLKLAFRKKYRESCSVVCNANPKCSSSQESANKLLLADVT